MSFSNTACTNTDTLGKKVSGNKIFGIELRGISTANTRAPCAKSNILCSSLQFLQFLKKKKKLKLTMLQALPDIVVLHHQLFMDKLVCNGVIV